MGLLELQRELSRQVRAGQDDKYLRRFVYFFELRVPPSVAKGATSTFIYPLIIPPENYRMSEPFEVTQTYTNGAGLWLEENGVVARTINLRGTTGFKPRAFPKVGKASGASGAVPYEGKSHSRSLHYSIAEALSGLRHFQFLQDAVFRTYGDLKRDPATNEGTELYWHNPFLDEHWRVVPIRFNTTHDAKRTTLLEYDIELLAVEGAASANIVFSEDAEVLKKLTDAPRTLRNGVSLIQSAILDLANVQGQLRNTIKGIGGVIDDAGSIAAATEDFLDGTKRLISVPLDYLASTHDALDNALSAFDSALVLGSSEDVPDSVLNIVRRIGDGLNIIGSYPDKFQNSIDAAVDSFQKKADLSTTRSQTQLALAREQPAPQTLREFNQLGTDLLPGDYLRARDELGLGRNTPRYTSAEERIIEHGDTLANLAARYLGDARRWKFIAVFNNLQPPFISEMGLPGTVTVGDRILIPNFAKPPEVRANIAVLGTRGDQPGDEHALGVDVLVSDAGNGFYDLVIDEEHGSVDVKDVRGVANLQQAIRTRLITERGHDVLYKSLGVHRVVGLGLTVVDKEVAQLRLIESLQADPRIAAVRGISFENEPSDTLTAEIDVEVRGLARPEKVLVRSTS